MISSGIQLSQALNIISNQCTNKIINESIKNIKKSIFNGKTLYESLKKYSNIYPRFMIEMINVGEKSGKLENILEKLSEYYEKQHRILSKIKSSMLYPIAVLVASILVVIFLMTKIIPQFIDIINSFNGEIPFLTRSIVDVCFFIKKNYFPLIITLILMLFILYEVCQSSRLKPYFHKLKLNFIFLGKLYNKYILAKFSIVMSMLLNAGLPITKALEITIDVLDNKIIENKIYNCMQHIKKGESLYSTFKNYNVGNDLLLSLVNIGEESGNLDYMLYKAGEILENDVEEKLKRITVFIEPMIIIFLALFIGTFVVAGLLPIISIMDSIN